MTHDLRQVVSPSKSVSGHVAGLPPAGHHHQGHQKIDILKEINQKITVFKSHALKSAISKGRHTCKGFEVAFLKGYDLRCL